MSILVVGIIVFVILFGGGFFWGWFVRNWEVKRLRQDYKKLIDHALQSGWVVSQEELIKNLFEIGIYVPYIPATFSDSPSEPSQAEVICDLLEKCKGQERPNQ